MGLTARQYYTGSDSTLKKNINPIDSSAINILKQLKAYTYSFKKDSTNKLNFGFLAQEVNQILPNIVSTFDGDMAIDYQQIIPLLVEAMKEQQSIIDTLIEKSTNRRTIINNSTNSDEQMDSLRREISKLYSMIESCCNKNNATSMLPNTSSVKNKLFQNKPNPFSEKTIIQYEVIEKMESASILLFDMQGSLKSTIPIYQSGKGQITINENELNAGMYIYTLIVNNQEIDSKRMILIK
jgi:hypothetical protein